MFIRTFIMTGFSRSASMMTTCSCLVASIIRNFFILPVWMPGLVRPATILVNTAPSSSHVDPPGLKTWIQPSLLSRVESRHVTTLSRSSSAKRSITGYSNLFVVTQQSAVDYRITSQGSTSDRITFFIEAKTAHVTHNAYENRCLEARSLIHQKR